MDKEHLYIITDCGSTTTKTIACGQTTDGTWKLLTWAVAPTTVEKPSADVTIGVRNSFSSLESKAKEKGAEIHVSDGTFLATSSAGGGLRIAVVGLTTEITLSAISQAALHAGAILCATVSIDDERTFDERLLLLKDSKPDIVLVAGGYQGRSPHGLKQILFLLKEARLTSRLGADIQIPLIYSGSEVTRDLLSEELGDLYELTFAEPIVRHSASHNLRPTELAVHEKFLTSVMQHAPGYRKLVAMVDASILPTPVAVTTILEKYSNTVGSSLLCIDMGGATTDIFSTGRPNARGVRTLYRSVSSNVGMSYSAVHVLNHTGTKAIKKFLPENFSDEEIETSIHNKMLRPTTVPEDEKELLIEQALCRVGLQVSMQGHNEIVKAEEESSVERASEGISRIFEQNKVKIAEGFDIIIASGGVFSHNPNPSSIPWILGDGLNLAGMNEIFVDRLFMLPHLGALSVLNDHASFYLLEHECITSIGILISISSKKKTLSEFEITVNGERVQIPKGSYEYIVTFENAVQEVMIDSKFKKSFSRSHHSVFLGTVPV